MAPKTRSACCELQPSSRPSQRRPIRRPACEREGTVRDMEIRPASALAALLAGYDAAHSSGPLTALPATDDPRRRTQEQRPEGHAAAHQDPRGLPEHGAAAHDGRRRLQGVADRGRRHRPGHGLSRADAVRAGGPAQAQPLRERQVGVRAQRGPTPRPPGVPDLRPGRGVLRRRDRDSASARWRKPGLRAAGSRAGRCTPGCTKNELRRTGRSKQPERR